MGRNAKDIIIIRPLPMKDRLKPGKLYLPVGPLYLARSLIDSGYRVSIIDTSNREAIRRIAQITTKNTIAFGISTMSGTQLKNAIIIAKKLKSSYPNIPVIWGGVHVTALPEQTLKSELVDYIVWGEGEDTFPRLVKAIQEKETNVLHNLPGIGFKENEELIIGLNSGYTSLNKTFNLPYHLLPMNQYARELIVGAKREFPIFTSRGCPFRCRYCSNSSKIWPNTRLRYHTIDHIINDVKTLVKKYGADTITFNDENFLINEKRFIDILEAIRAEGLFIKYRFAARIDQLLKLSEGAWDLMKEYGIISIGVAPESGSQKILDYMGKNITLEQIYKVDELLSKYEIYKSFNFLICTPKETKEDLKLTLKLVSFLARTSIDSPYPLALHKYIPLPGTEMYVDAVNSGFIAPDRLQDWTEFDFDEIERTIDSVRPWIAKEYFPFVNKSLGLIEELNVNMKGPGSNKAKINDILHELDVSAANS